MRCNKNYNLDMLSLYLDGELKLGTQMREHVETCLFCQMQLTAIEKIEQQIYEYEKCQENFVSVEVFDVAMQKRNIFSLDWKIKYLYWKDNVLTILDEDSINSVKAATFKLASETMDSNDSQQTMDARIKKITNLSYCKLYLHFFWYGNVGIYVENCNFPLNVKLQRGKRLISVAQKKEQRIIVEDSLLLFNSLEAIYKITWKIPKVFLENSVTKKLYALTHASQNFLSRFFHKLPSATTVYAWQQLKSSHSARDIAIYWAHTKTQFPYERLALDFKTPVSVVSRTIIRMRKKMMRLLLTADV